MPDSPRLPADFPPLLVAAEEMAREAHDLFGLLTWGVEDGWSELGDDAQATLVQVHAHLLANLPRSRSFWREWLGKRVGLDVSGGIVFTRMHPRGAKSWDWQVEDWNGSSRVVLPTSRISDPNAALLLALLSVEPHHAR